jgi:hypothetical protein
LKDALNPEKSVTRVKAIEEGVPNDFPFPVDTSRDGTDWKALNWSPDVDQAARSRLPGERMDKSAANIPPPYDLPIVVDIGCECKCPSRQEPEIGDIAMGKQRGVTIRNHTDIADNLISCIDGQGDRLTGA